MGHFADIDEQAAEQQRGEALNTYDLSHSGQSLQLMATPGIASRQHYQGNALHSVLMAQTEFHTTRTTDYTRIHASNTVSQHTLMAPHQFEHLQCGQQLLHTYQTRTDHWQTVTQHETILHQHMVENHLQTYQLHAPATLTENTPTHLLQAHQLKHTIQKQTLQAGTWKHQVKLAQIKGPQATIKASQVGLGGDKLVLSD